MSIPERIYRLGKSYIGQVRDNIDAKLAEKELDAAEYEAQNPDREDSSPDAMMRRAEQRIASARRELEDRNRAALEAQGTAAPQAATAAVAATASTSGVADPNAADFRMLGVPAGSDYPVVQAAYEDLARRCDPARFPAGSGEQKQAQAILDKVNQAYESLRQRLDPMQNRFGKLEFE